MKNTLKPLNFLRIFPKYRELLQEGEVFLKQQDIHVKLVPTLFDVSDIVVGEKVYAVFNKSIKEILEEMARPLFDLFAEEERYEFLKKEVNLKEIWHYDSFQELLKTGEFTSDDTSHYVKLSLMVHDNVSEVMVDPEGLFDAAEIALLHGDNPKFPDVDAWPWNEEFLVSVRSLMNGSENHEIDLAFECDDLGSFILRWSDNKILRLQIVTGTSKNPNEESQNDLIELFKEEELVKTMKRHPLVSEHYSNFEERKVAFNIKVYEDFVHPQLFELGVLTYDDDSFHRDEEINFLRESLESEFAVTYEGQVGRSGGYMLLSYENDLDKEDFLKMAEEIKEAVENDYKRYQELETYEYKMDVIEEELLEIAKTGDEEKKKTAQALLDEIRSLLVKMA